MPIRLYKEITNEDLLKRHTEAIEYLFRKTDDLQDEVDQQSELIEILQSENKEILDKLENK